MLERSAGIDIGGTNIRGGIISDGNFEKVFETSTPGNFIDFKKKIDEAVYLIKEKAEENLPVGFAIPGLLDQKNKKVTFSPNLQFLNGLKFSEIYPESIFANDADMALFGEIENRAALDNVALFNIGTGVGFAFIVDGKGSWEMTNAGEAGHFKVLPGGEKCHCGKKGCLEAYFSGTSFARQAKTIDSELSVKELFMMARNKDGKALKIIVEASRLLGIAIANVVNLLGVETILIGGKLALDYDLFINTTFATAKENIFASEYRNLTFEKSSLIDKAAIIGAGRLALKAKNLA